MRSDRLARALLRLYPRAWRARYGDEFLELLAESGLSWRAVLDVVAAAGVERVRAVTALVRHQGDPTDALLHFSFRDLLADVGAFMTLVCLTVWGLGQIGVHHPSWIWWANVVGQCSTRRVETATLQRWADRLVASFWWFAAATAVTGLGWLTAATLNSLGIPKPSTRTWYAIFGIVFACAAGRFLYCYIWSMSYGSKWPGMHRREVRAWNAALFLVAVVTALVDPAGDAFWWLALMFWWSLRPSFWLTRAGGARRRGQYGAIFGSDIGGPQPPA